MINILTRAIPPLVFLMGLTGMSDAQFGSCDYEQIIEVGKSYYLFSPNFANGKYPAGSTCRWIAKSDRSIKMTCDPFSVPEVPRCTLDVVLILTSNSRGQRHCGTRSFSVVSEGNQLVTMLNSSLLSPGGRFYCTLEAVSSDTECACGWKNPTKIVGGVDSGINEFPMMAALIDVKSKIAFCGATIINPYQVVTVAHCLNGKIEANMGVLVGDHDLTKGNETTATKLFRVKYIARHPLYSPNVLDYDIAVINIDGTIKFNQKLGPACLPFQHSSDSFAGNFVELLGWGSLDNDDRQSSILQKVKVSVITNKDCMKAYSGIASRQLCTYTDGKDSCQFDSGGPVLWQNPTTHRVVLVAMVAYGSLCADKKPSVNSRIGAFMDFLISQAPQGYKYCDDE